jgi:serine/threonine protein kinase
MAIRIEESPTRGLLPELEPVKSRTKQRMWHKLHRFFGRDGSPGPSPRPSSNQRSREHSANLDTEDRQSGPRRDFGRRLAIGLPRPGTFRRQNSEKREKLELIEPCPSERRAVSAQRHQRALSAYRPRSRSSPSPQIPSRVSAPTLSLSNGTSEPSPFSDHFSSPRASTDPTNLDHDGGNKSPARHRSPSRSSSEGFDELARDEKDQIDLELDTKWILNLSMHFRDKSDREKFFVTYAERPNRWRRVTISCDYRNSEPDSLEMDLKELQYQRDKNAQIYESIRDSLSSIQFYNTVTNLKLQTEDSRLHVHVTEDVNEIIPYPPRMSVYHILNDRSHPIMEARESQLHFLSHLSGFVYKVSFQGREYIKKEIPGPDTVDEFLYEINALHALCVSTSVIKLEAIVVDDSREMVKGLLISYAERGALVDLLYDLKGKIPWSDRMRWARQAIQGLSEVHEEGYVQGDFTLSNIVINSDNDAKIIDINRRGCPVGWEPPEIAKKIASNQRISMYIGQKSDLFQLGMTLWALAMDEDEPERHDQPLSMGGFSDEIPDWYKDLVDICLSPQPRERLSAKELLLRFPLLPRNTAAPRMDSISEVPDERSPKRYIDPSAAVEREDLERLGRSRRRSSSEGRSLEDVSLIDPPSSSYQFDSGSSFVGIRRGRRRASDPENVDDHQSGHRRSSENGPDPWNETDLQPHIISVSPGREPRYEGLGLDSHINLPQRPYARPEDQIMQENESPEHESFESGAEQTSALALLESVPEAQHEPGSRASDADIELPSPHTVAPEHGSTSLASDSTPRNAPSVMAASTSSIPPVPPPPLDLATADLAGFGGAPSLDDHSPHEPMKTPDTQSSSQYYDTQPQQKTSLNSADDPDIANEPPSTTNSAESHLPVPSTDLPRPAEVPEPPEIPIHTPVAPEENQPLQFTAAADIPSLATLSEAFDPLIPRALAEEKQALPVPS